MSFRRTQRIPGHRNHLVTVERGGVENLNRFLVPRENFIHGAADLSAFPNSARLIAVSKSCICLGSCPKQSCITISSSTVYYISHLNVALKRF
jgi:hypothetical protein